MWARALHHRVHVLARTGSQQSGQQETDDSGVPPALLFTKVCRSFDHLCQPSLDDALCLGDHAVDELLARRHRVDEAHHCATRPDTRVDISRLLEAGPIVLQTARDARGEAEPGGLSR